MVSALLLIAARPQASVPAPAQGAVPNAAGSEIDRPLVAEKKWAICIGAGEYKSLAPLKYAPTDAVAFSKSLREGYSFDPSTVTLISDAPEAKLRPTVGTIQSELKRLLADRRLDRGDLFVFYFSGHGVGTPTGDYLMPTDVAEADAERDALPVKELVGAIVRSGLKNVLIIADACRSGKSNPFGRELQDLGRKANIAVLLGCQPGQRSYEYPRLGKGVFTHFLVKAMEDRSLVPSASGALWASAVAKQTATSVREYTEADYGEDAQIPAVWSEPSQDVLLAAYPPSPETLGKSIAEAGTLDRDRYGRYLSSFGRELSDGGRHAEAIETFKTLDGLGVATWRDLSLLVFALHKEDRDNEIGSLVDRALREPVPTEFSEFVVTQGRPDFVGRERYRRALAAWVRPADQGFVAVTYLVAAMRTRLNDSDADIARALAPFVPLYASDSAEGRFLAANVALGERRYAEAISLAESAAASGGTSFIRDLRQVRYVAAQALVDDAKVDAIIGEGLADSDDRYPWLDVRLRRMHARKDPGVTEAATAFAAGVDRDARLLSAIRALGTDAEVLRPNAERLVKAHPYSWRAAINLWLTIGAEKDYRTIAPIPEAALKYAPDPSELVSYALDQWAFLVEDSLAAGKMSGWYADLARRGVLAYYFAYLGAKVEDPEILLSMGTLLVRTAQPIRGVIFAETFIGPQLERSPYAARELRLIALYLAINGDQPEMAKAAFARLERDGDLAPRAIIRYATYRALDGDLKEAERALGLWDTMGIGAPSGLFETYFTAIRAYLDVRRGDKAAAQAKIDVLKEGDPSVSMLAYLTQYEITGRKGLNLEWIEALADPAADFIDLRTASLRALAEGYAEDSSPEGRDLLTKVSLLLTDTPGLRRTREFAFENRAGLANYAGFTLWKGRMSEGREYFDAEMSLGVTSSGQAFATIRIPSLPGVWKGTGEVDDEGNLFLDLKDEADGKELGVFTMKLPPTGIERRGGSAASYSFNASVVGTPIVGIEFSLKCEQSATTAEIVAREKARAATAKPPKAPVKKTPPRAPTRSPAKRPLKLQSL